MAPPSKIVKTKKGQTRLQLAHQVAAMVAHSEEKAVVDESTWEETLEKIIERDFFPDNRPLQLQLQYFQAVERNDLRRLRELQVELQTTPSAGLRTNVSTPGFFETPLGREPSSAPALSEDERPGTISDDVPSNPPARRSKDPSALRLDEYLTRHTSEDNASFNELIEVAEQRHRVKHSWMYREAEAGQLQLQQSADPSLPGPVGTVAVPSCAVQALEGCSSDVKAVESWPYEDKSSVYYVPDQQEASLSELMARQREKPQEVILKNTRLEQRPSGWSAARRSGTAAVIHEGKIDIDGKPIMARTPGSRLLATPSPVPGVDASPLMTWGYLGGTPAPLDDHFSEKGPTFKVPAVPHRDELAHQLAEQFSKQHRSKKLNALKLVASSVAAAAISRQFGSSTSQRLESLSPAARRLTSGKGEADPIRASYSPAQSPARSPSSARSSATPASLRSLTQTPPVFRSPSSASSLTDNLLKLASKRLTPSPATQRLTHSPATLRSPALSHNQPLVKKKKAADFF